MKILFLFSCLGWMRSSQTFNQLPKFSTDEVHDFLERNRERVPILLNEGVSTGVFYRLEHLKELVVPYRVKDNKDTSATVVVALFKGKQKVQERRKLAEDDDLIPNLEKLIIANYPKNFIQLDKDNVQFYLAKYVVEEKKPVAVLYETPGLKSVVFRAICNASEFSEFQFFIWSEDLAAMNHYLKLESVPAVVYFTLPAPTHPQGQEPEAKKSGMEIKKMPGAVTFTNTIMFLRYMLNERKAIQELLEKQKNEQVFDSSFVIIGDGRSPSLETELKACHSTHCLLFFDRVTRKAKDSFNKTTRDLKTVQSKFAKETLKVILLDWVCHLNILAALGVEEKDIPLAIIYTSYKNSKFMVLQTVDPNDIVSSVRYADSEHMVWQKQLQPFKFRSQSCVEINEEFEAKKENLETDL